jgi:polyphenol oxidase
LTDRIRATSVPRANSDERGLMRGETYRELAFPGLRHYFTLRSELPPDQLPCALRPTLAQAGFPTDSLITAEQPHGAAVAVVSEATTQEYLGVDALATNLVGVTLLIRVADCGPVFFYDPVRRVIALAHSGKKGTALNIVGQTVNTLQTAWGVNPADLHVFLGPCIRPPHYEIDFATEIGRQAQQAGIGHYADSGICTATHIERYYSYRAEKGQTGRMWAVLRMEICRTQAIQIGGTRVTRPHRPHNTR